MKVERILGGVEAGVPRPTRRGWKTLIVLALVLLVSILFSDSILLLASALLSGLLAASLADLVWKIRKAGRAVVEPPTLGFRLLAGEEERALLRLRSSTPLELDVEEAWLSFRPKTVRPPETAVEVSVKPMLSGVYRISGLRVRIRSLLDLFQARAKLPLRLRLVARPRVYSPLHEAARMLEAVAKPGGIPVVKRGGLEYAGSREYRIGDDVSSIDWKASARHRKIIVKEFLEESYGSVEVIYDVRAHGPVTRDQCRAYFLSAVVSASKMGLPVSILIKRGEEILAHRGDMGPAEALRLSLAYTAEEDVAWRLRSYNVFKPKPTRMLLRVSRKVGSEAFRRIAELRLSGSRKRLSRICRSGRRLILYIGCILIDSGFVKDLVAEVSSLGGEVVILSPPKPWLDARDLEEAYLMYGLREKLLKAFKALRASLAP